MFSGSTGRFAVPVLLACLTWSACAAAADAPAPAPALLVRADPPVPRPSSTPCTQELVRLTSTGAGHGYFYFSPYNCGAGPWAKVVMEMDFVTSEDPDGKDVPLPLTIWLAGVNLHFGSIALTGRHDLIGPCEDVYCGHLERDVTDYMPLLRYREGAPLEVGNWVVGVGQEASAPGASFSGIAQLKYYPATATEPAPAVPDAVFPLGARDLRFGSFYITGALADLRKTTDRLSAAFNVAGTQVLPRNIERAYLDVVVRPSTYNYVPTSPTAGVLDHNDPWYSCLPVPLAAAFPRLLLDEQHGFAAHCLGGAFREAEVSIDDQPAGVVPMYPSYPSMGERDDKLWRPSMQPQEFMYLPHRVDLSPFAALLSNGAPHTVAVRIASNSRPGLTNNPVAGAWASASLLVYQDRRVKQITGGITRNDLINLLAVPRQSSTVARDRAGNVGGSVLTSLHRHYVIDGYVDGSKGRIRHRVERWANFDHTQAFDVPAEPSAPLQRKVYQKTITLRSTETGKTRTYVNGVLAGEHVTNYGYPMSSFYYLWHDPTVEREIKKFRQDVGLQLVRRENGNMVYSAVTQNLTGGALDTTTGLYPYRVFTKVNDRGSWQTFRYSDSLGGCYDAMLTTRDGALATSESGASCTDGQNRLPWQSRPDGSPDGLGWIGYP